MKTIVTVTSLLSLLTLVAVTQLAALVSLPGLTPIALVGGLVAAGVLAFAFSDYSHKPARRVRRRSPLPNMATPATSRSPGAAGCDWTYSTRAA